jgi:arylsulfatase A
MDSYPCLSPGGKLLLAKCIAGVGSLLLLYSCMTGRKNPVQPNIVLILADDLGYGDLSCLNKDSKIQTPNIDMMAASGVVFTDAHSSSGVSTPTRYGIMTGRYSWRSTMKSGVLDGYSAALIPSARNTIASMLKKEGYNTGYVGKWHLGWGWNNIEKGKDSIDYSKPVTNGPVTLGFDYFYGFSGSLDMPPYVYVENEMPTALPDRETIGNNAPVGDPEYDGSMWRKGPTGSDFDHKDCLPNLIRRAGKYISDKSPSSKPYFLYLALPSPHTPILPSDDLKGTSGLNPYADYVIMVDRMVGEILNAVEQTGEAENTMVVFTSDNGCAPWADFKTLLSKGHNPSYIFRGTKADLYEGGHHIPLLMKWPAKVKKPHSVTQTVCLNDMMATLAAITGYELKDDEGEDSFNLLPAILNPDYKKKIREATVHHSVNGNFAIRKGDLKLLLSPGSGGWSSPKPGKEEVGLPAVQLYNMKEDPGETINLQDKYPDTVKELTMLLKKYIEEGRSTPGLRQKNDGLYPWKQIGGIIQ